MNYTVKLMYQDVLSPEIEVQAVIERKDALLFQCKPLYVEAPCQYDHCILYLNNVEIHRTKMDREIMLLHGDSLHFTYVLKD